MPHVPNVFADAFEFHEDTMQADTKAKPVSRAIKAFEEREIRS